MPGKKGSSAIGRKKHIRENQVGNRTIVVSLHRRLDRTREKKNQGDPKKFSQERRESSRRQELENGAYPTPPPLQFSNESLVLKRQK